MAFQWIGKSQDGETVTLHRLKPTHFTFPEYFTDEWARTGADLIRTGVVLDVETSGLKPETSRIIELGIRPFRFNRETGEVLELLEGFSAFEDPGFPLSDEVKKLTGITDEMLSGKKIQWDQVEEILSQAHIIIAHNAAFDRPFVDRSSKISATKIWGCSFKQIDWNGKGFPSQKLDLLSVFHGFFTDSHRALNDSDALLYLLSLSDQSTHKPYLHELLSQAKKGTCQIQALSAPFESKDLLKDRGYRWNAQTKFWWKEISEDLIHSETAWLSEFVYTGPFRGRTIEIPPTEHFKGISSPS